MEVIKLGQKAANKAVDVIGKGGVVIFPTDTVYGFLADAYNKKAVEKIFKIKKRQSEKPLPVFVKDIKMAKELAEINKDQEKIIKKYWPGKYTFVLKSQIPMPKFQTNPKFQILNSKLLTKNGTIAIRIPKYKFLNDLLKKIDKPLAQTSVNISGKPALIKIKEIIAEFGTCKNKPDLIVNRGDFEKAKPSKIVDLTKNKVKILRI